MCNQRYYFLQDMFTASKLRILFCAIAFCVLSCVASNLSVNKAQNEERSQILDRRSWAVKLPEGVNPDAVATRDGFVNKGRIGSLKNHWLFEPLEDDKKPSSRIQRRSSVEIDTVFRKDEIYEWSEEQIRRPRYRKLEFNDPLWPSSWYLHKDAYPGQAEDIGVLPVWEMGIFGKGVHIAVVDDGVQGDHPDLVDQFVAETSYDFLFKTLDVSPKQPIDSHGTRCAGEIVSKPNNNLCSVGVAYMAKISGLKIIGDIFPNDADEAAALSHRLDRHHIFSSSWGPKDDGASLDGPGPLARAAMEFGVAHGRGGKGVLYVFAGGNGGARSDNCNFDGYANSLSTITIGGLSPLGKLPFYSEPCAAHLAVMFGGSDGKFISTTDMYSGCTSQHTGTSAAAPLVSGILALLLEKRPDLSYRDVQHLIARSTIINDKTDDDWIPNRAGRLVNHKYGFGLLNAEKIIKKAEDWQLIPTPLLSFEFPRENKHYEIPIGPNKPLRIVKIINPDRAHTLSFIEQIQVEVKIRHPVRGSLVIRLWSPEDRRSHSVLATARPHDKKSTGFNNWKFSTVRHWDESPLGNWTLEIEDTRQPASGNGQELKHGYLESWSMKFTGRCSDEDTYLDPVSNERKCLLERDKKPAMIIIEEKSTNMFFLGMASAWAMIGMAWILKRFWYHCKMSLMRPSPTHMESSMLLQAEEGGDGEYKKSPLNSGEKDANSDNTLNSPNAPLLKTVLLKAEKHNVTQRSPTPNRKHSSIESNKHTSYSSITTQNLLDFEDEANAINCLHVSNYNSSPRSLSLSPVGSNDKLEMNSKKTTVKPLTLKNLNPLPKLSNTYDSLQQNDKDKGRYEQ